MGRFGGKAALVVLVLLVAGISGAHSAPLAPSAPVAPQVVEVLYAEADTPAEPTSISPGSPLSTPISFGNSFASVSEVCLIFHFTDDLLDSGDELSTSWGIGFLGSGAPQRDRGICTSASADTNRLLDGTEPLEISMDSGSVTLGALVVKITGDSIGPMGYRISSDLISYVVAQGDLVDVTTTVTDDLDAAAPPAVTLSNRTLVPAGTFATDPTGGTPTFTSDGVLSTSTSTDPGDYRLVVTAKGGGFTRSYDVTVTVTESTAPLTVNSTNDADDETCDATHCSLREAINAANESPGLDTIEFDLADTLILLTSDLPVIDDPVVIDGTSQAEGQVVIDGGEAEAIDGVALDDGSDGSTIEGLEIQGFSGAGIRVGSGGNTVRGNVVHDSADGVVVSGLDAANNTIGGSFADGDGNEIYSFSGTGVALSNAGSANKVQGNTIGVHDNETDGGSTGISVFNTPGAVIGAQAGTGEGFVTANQQFGNVVGGAQFDGEAGGHGIQITGAPSTGTIVTFNYVGTNRTGGEFGNSEAGIRVSGASNLQLGPSNVVTNNGSTATGVRIESGSGNRIVANSIFGNVGLGIQLDDGANGNLDAPTLTGAVPTGSGTANVSGSISGPTGDYFVEFFRNGSCDSSGDGEGETYVGFTTATISEIGTSFTGATFTGVEAGDVITATSTGASTNNTSEFSNCVTVTEGDGEPGVAPILFGAVPDATPGTLGVGGVIDTGDPTAGQVFDVDFYSVPSCSAEAPKTPLGTGFGFETNENGLAAFAKDGLTNVAVGALVTATSTPFGGSPSPISNCVVADRNNTNWPTALELGANDTETGHLRALGEARWFKVPILPASRVHVTLSGLPADYDLVVFSDIQATYDRLVGGEDFDEEVGPNLALDDLDRAGAETPSDVYNTSQYNPSSWDATNWDPNLNDNLFGPQFSPTQFSESLWSATTFSPTQFSPTQFSPTQFSPTQFSPTQFSPTQFSPTQFSTAPWASFNPADPRAFSAAQTQSLLAVAAGPGTGDERISVNTWNNTGHFYIRVQGKNGSFDAEEPFTLQVEREGNLCSGLVQHPSSPSAPGGSLRTLVLVDGSRMTIPASLSAKLATFVARPEVNGAVVQVGSDAAVSALNAQADAKASCPFAKNLVADAIKRIVDAYRETNPIEYAVVIGGDGVIPFYRYPDPALLGNETMYVPPVRDDSASQASLRLGYILNQDGYASTDSISLKGNLFPVPDLAIGRLVETPAEIEGMLDAYLSTAGGVVPTPTSALVTGYDFLTDTADAIADHLDAGIGAAANEELITNQTTSPGVVSDGLNNAESYYRTRSWTATDLRRELVDTGRDLVFLAGHFSANDALAADYRTNVLSTELAASTADYENAIVWSAGCHAGYNVVNDHATTWTEPLDWAQAFAQKRATLISGTGYQYGDTDFIAHSERIYAEFARQLRVTGAAGGAPEPVAVGHALLRSKQIFLEQTPGLTPLDEKSLLQTTLFGLPMLSVNLPNGRIAEATDPSVVPGTESVETGPGAVLGLEVANLNVGPGLTARQKQLQLSDGTNGPLATWLEGPDGVAVRPTQPILPLDSLNVTVDGRSLRGVGFRTGTYTDAPSLTPLTAAPATELRGIHAPFLTDVFIPTQPWTTNHFGALPGGSGVTRLHATPVQHKSNSPTSSRRQFSNLGLRLFYSSNVASYCPGTDPLALAPCPGGVAIAPALAAPPTITGVETEFDAGTLTFKARVLGELVAGIQEVWVTYTIPPGPGGGAGSWQSITLSRDADDLTLWTGELTGVSDPAAVLFLVQAANGVGRVTMDHNFGAFYRHGAIPGPPAEGAPQPAGTTMAFVTAPPASAAFGTSFTVRVRLTAGGAGGSALAGKLVRLGISEASLPALTNASGEAEVTLRASLTPDTYPVVASFGGDSTHAPSGVTDEITVVRRPTTMALTGTLGSGVPLTATLRATSPLTPLHQRTVFVVLQGAATRVYGGTTNPQGQVIVSKSFLDALPAGSYTASAHFNGVTLPGGVAIPPDDLDYAPSSAALTPPTLWPFEGFFGHVSPPALNEVARAGGATIPIKFSLGANRGLNIFASGYPRVGQINCTTGVPIGAPTAAQNSGFRYDSGNRHYTYDWRTQSAWRATCRQLVVRFVDGTERALWFRFR